MRKELDEQLCREFPLLYRDRFADMRMTCMCWGFPGDGWFGPIYRLSQQLEPMIAAAKIICACGHEKHEGQCLDLCYCTSYADARPVAVQVKEKFGGLRFYMHYSTKEMEALIAIAEEECSKTCEECGVFGVLRSGGWLLTRCDWCAKKTRDQEDEEDDEE